ncbi:MAG: hypothetical protein WCC73_06370, partial [Terracidiphilus sp.]
LYGTTEVVRFQNRVKLTHCWLTSRIDRKGLAAHETPKAANPVTFPKINFKFLETFRMAGGSCP